MPWGYAAVAVGTIAAGAMSSNAAKKGANAQQDAANASIAEQQREYDQSRQDQLPFLQAGQNALNLQQQYLSGDTSGFSQSPDYQFAVQQGTKQLDAGAAAKGNLWGGGADADRIALGQGLATQYANNYWNKLAGMAGQGQSSANTLGNLGANMANQTGNYLTNAGQARASSYAGTANAYNNTLSQLGNIGGQLYQNYYGPQNQVSPMSSSGNIWSGTNFNTGSNGSYNFAAMSGGS